MYCEKLNDFLKMNQQQLINRQKFKRKMPQKKYCGFSLYIYIIVILCSIFLTRINRLFFKGFTHLIFTIFYNQATLSIVLQGENDIWILKKLKQEELQNKN